MTRAPIKPNLIRWARERSGKDVPALLNRFPKLVEWEAGERQPTLKQLQAFANAVHVPVGYLFLPEPPDEPLPVPDFRTVGGKGMRRASPELLDTLYACQERQAWYRDFARLNRLPEVKLISSATTETSAETAAAALRAYIGFSLDERSACATWEDALRLLVRQAEAAGVLVMVSGVARENTHRPLDPEEFRGFALVDRLAPLVFVNGADTKAAQNFTLAHELAHLCLGAPGLSDLGPRPAFGHRREEVWCNAVAAEFLVPLKVLRAEVVEHEQATEAAPRLARRFKVSTLVVLRRLLDAGRLDRGAFDIAWREENARLRGLKRPGSGGDFYRTTLSRVGRRFTRAVFESTLEGQTLYRDAFRMLGVSKSTTFENLGREVGVVH